MMTIDELKAIIALSQDEAEKYRTLPDADHRFIDGFQAGMEWVLMRVEGK